MSANPAQRHNETLNAFTDSIKHFSKPAASRIRRRLRFADEHTEPESKRSEEPAPQVPVQPHSDEPSRQVQAPPPSDDEDTNKLKQFLSSEFLKPKKFWFWCVTLLMLALALQHIAVKSLHIVADLETEMSNKSFEYVDAALAVPGHITYAAASHPNLGWLARDQSGVVASMKFHPNSATCMQIKVFRVPVMNVTILSGHSYKISSPTFDAILIHDKIGLKSIFTLIDDNREIARKSVTSGEIINKETCWIKFDSHVSAFNLMTNFIQAKSTNTQTSEVYLTRMGVAVTAVDWTTRFCHFMVIVAGFAILLRVLALFAWAFVTLVAIPLTWAFLVVKISVVFIVILCTLMIPGAIVLSALVGVAVLNLFVVTAKLVVRVCKWVYSHEFGIVLALLKVWEGVRNFDYASLFVGVLIYFGGFALIMLICHALLIVKDLICLAVGCEAEILPF